MIIILDTNFWSQHLLVALLLCRRFLACIYTRDGIMHHTVSGNESIATVAVETFNFFYSTTVVVDVLTNESYTVTIGRW
jgi:hypothetical protein